MAIRRKQQLKKRRKMKTPESRNRVVSAMQKSEQMWLDNFGLRVKYMP